MAVLDLIEARRPFEDSLVELKGAWPDTDSDEKAYKTARQLAGHLNAARGDAVVWLIGVSDKAGICGAPTKDLANEWWPSLAKHFDHLPPQMIHVVVGRGGKPVTAIRFDGAGLPFVVRVFNKTREYDTPWRDGSSTRSATRAELIRILTPEARRPLAEVLSASTEGEHFHCFLFIVQRGPDPIRFVRHRTVVEYEGNPGWKADVELVPDRSKHDQVEPWIHMTPSGIVMDRGGSLIVKGRCPLSDAAEREITVRLAHADPGEAPLVIRIAMVKRGRDWVRKT